MRKLTYAFALLLTIAVSLSLATTPLLHTQTPHPPAFDVVTIKRSRTIASPGIESRPNGDTILLTNMTPRLILGFAYDVQLHDGIYGLPAWADSETYDITAKVAASDLPAFRALLPRQRNPMLQPLLADRFHLQCHFESRLLPAYALNIAKSGARLNPIQPPADQDPGNIRTAPGSIVADYAPIAPLLDALSVQLGRPVVDHTGLTGRYSFTLHFAPAQASTDATSDPGPSLFTAIENQLGLKLEPTKAPTQVLVVDRIERPSGN